MVGDEKSGRALAGEQKAGRGEWEKASSFFTFEAQDREITSTGQIR